jgi:hypothetical protein
MAAIPDSQQLRQHAGLFALYQKFTSLLPVPPIARRKKVS